MTEQPQDADAANARLEAAIQRHAGWQLEYDFGIVIRDRKRLLAEIDRLNEIIEEADCCNCMAVYAAKSIVEQRHATDA